MILLVFYQKNTNWNIDYYHLYLREEIALITKFREINFPSKYKYSSDSENALKKIFKVMLVVNKLLFFEN